MGEGAKKSGKSQNSKNNCIKSFQFPEQISQELFIDHSECYKYHKVKNLKKKDYDSSTNSLN